MGSTERLTHVRLACKTTTSEGSTYHNAQTTLSLAIDPTTIGAVIPRKNLTHPDISLSALPDLERWAAACPDRLAGAPLPGPRTAGAAARNKQTSHEARRQQAQLLCGGNR